MHLFQTVLLSILLIFKCQSVYVFNFQETLYPQATILITFNLTELLPISPDNFSIVMTQVAPFYSQINQTLDNPEPFNQNKVSNYGEPVTWLVMNPTVFQCTLYLNMSINSDQAQNCFEDRRCFRIKRVPSESSLPIFLFRAYTIYKPPTNLIQYKKNYSLMIFSERSYANATVNRFSWSDFENTIIVPWIPYISNCSDYGNFIDLHNVIRNSISQAYSYGNTAIDWKTKCRLPERPDSVPWWKKSPDTLFFIYSIPIKKENISQIYTEILYHKTLSRMEMLVPVQVVWATEYKNHLDRIELQISLYSTQMNYKIYSAQLKLYFTDESKEQNEFSIVIDNQIESSNSITRLVSSTSSSIRAAIALTSLCLILLYLTTITKVRKLKIVRFSQAIVLPIIKGYSLLMINGIGPIAIVLILIMFSQLGNMTDNFDSQDSSYNTKFLINNGRVGLAFLFCGVYLLLKMIDNTYKIPNAQQASILYRDYIKNEKNMPDEVEIQEKSEELSLIIKSKKYYIMAITTVVTIIQAYMSEQLVKSANNYYFLILLPICSEVQRQIVTWVFQDMMYSLPVLISMQFIYSQLCLTFKNYTQIILCQVFLRILCYGLPLLVEPVKRLYKRFRYRVFGEADSEKCHEYEETLWRLLNISVNISGIIMRILCLLICFLLRGQFQYVATIFPQTLLTNLTILLLLVPIEILLILNYLVILNGKWKFNIMEMFEYHQHRFRCRTHKWISDNFKYKETVKLEYRTVQKLCLSSQFHLYLAGMAFSSICLISGFVIINRNMYNPYKDPLSLILLAMIWILGKIWHMILSLICAKSKMYSLKEEKNLVKLDLTASLNKKEDLTQYLEYDVAKKHFIRYCRSWIINNLPNILSKRSFHQNNRKILNLYIEKLNNQKRKKLQVKKRQIELQIQAKKTKDNIGDGIHSLPRRVVENTVRPIIHRWLMLTRQHIFLNKYIAFTKIPQKFCEFCKIDVQLQVISKLPLLEVANAFRVQNIGKPFNPHEFINFYMQTQTLNTICFECKLKEEHLRLNEKQQINKVKNNICAKLMIRKWVMCARSRILHCRPS